MSNFVKICNKCLECFRNSDLYNQHRCDHDQIRSTTKIPKLIHQSNEVIKPDIPVTQDSQSVKLSTLVSSPRRGRPPKFKSCTEQTLSCTVVEGQNPVKFQEPEQNK